MATISYIYSSFIILLLLTLAPLKTQSKAIDNPFSFLKSLEGCRKGQNVDGLHHLKGYLARFGYLENHQLVSDNNKVTSTTMILNKDAQLFDETLEEAIKTYQKNYGLNVTGHLDAATVKQMMQPRCGTPDIINGKNTMLKKEHKTTSSSTYKNRKSLYGTSLYSYNGLTWPSSERQLTYQIQSETLVNGVENMRSIVADALNKWAQYSPFTFQEVAEGSESDLVFGFAQGDHGDGRPFDGPGGILGHSFFPTDGRSHYDATENWSDDPGVSDMDLNSVVLHEIGHLLGLGHSQDPNAVMFAGIGQGIRKRELQQDDVDGIQALYGAT